MLALGPALGPVLWQLPPTLGFDADRLRAFFDLLPRTTTAAAELATAPRRQAVRRPGLGDRPTPTARCATPWRCGTTASAPEEAVQLLAEHDIALVVADTAGRWPLLERVTSDFMYVRLHGDEELYVSGYSADGAGLLGGPDPGAGPTRGWTSSSTSTTTSRCTRRTTRWRLMERLGLTVG